MAATETASKVISGIMAAVGRHRDQLELSDESKLAQDLYQWLHLRRTNTLAAQGQQRNVVNAEAIFGFATRSEDGWMPILTPGGQHDVFVKGGLKIRIDPTSRREDGTLILPAIRDRYAPGFAALLSRHAPGSAGTRVYLPVKIEHAPQVGRLLSSRLADITERFVVKALTSHVEYPRPDAITIYVENRDRDAVLQMLRSVDVSVALDDARQHSLFARIEPSGVSWMEGVAHISAGEARAVSVARAIRGVEDPGDPRLENAIRDEFTKSGIDPAWPFRLIRSSR